MASEEERAHAVRLLEIHQGNLKRLEEKKALFGMEAPTWLENQMEQERANIAALQPLVKPPPSEKIQEFVKSTGAGEIDLMMLYLQGTQINARVTKQEEETQRIREEQGRASVWRVQTSEDVSTLVAQVGATEQARRHGAKWYRRALLVLAIGVLIALYFALR